MISISIKNFFIAYAKDMTQKHYLTKFASPVVHKAHRCKSFPLSHQYLKTPIFKLFFSLSVAPKQLDGFLLMLFSEHFHFRTTDPNLKPEFMSSSSAIS